MHTLHVGYVGLMGNLHYLEIVDFVLGIPGWDISGDDQATWLAKQADEPTRAIVSLPASSPDPIPTALKGKRRSTINLNALDWRP